MKDIEIGLIAELMKNSRRSDRELARALGISQPTVSRVIKKLEREGMIHEYTMIPALAKLGYEILAITLVKLKQVLNEEEIRGANMLIRETLKATTLGVLMIERGVGSGFDGIIISFHRSYSSYSNLVELLRNTEFLDMDRVASFLVNLRDDVYFIPLTFSFVAHELSSVRGKKE